jgi:Flp pilus assembly protein TadB
MRSALIEIDEALLQLLFLWSLGFAAGRRNQAATKKKKKKIQKKKDHLNKTNEKQKQKQKMVKKKRKKKRKTQSIKQSKAKPNFVYSLASFVCLSVCLCICVFVRLLSGSLIKSTRNGCLTVYHEWGPLARLLCCSNVVCRNCSIHEAQKA